MRTTYTPEERQRLVEANTHALEGLSIAIQQLSEGEVVAQVSVMTEMLMLHADGAAVQKVFNYHRAILKLLLVDCEIRGISQADAIRKEHEWIRRMEETGGAGR
jgi:hypothetical protein